MTATESRPMSTKELDDIWSQAKVYPDGLNFGGHTVLRLLATIAARDAEIVQLRRSTSMQDDETRYVADDPRQGPHP